MLFRSPPWDSVAYWALDLETGGLDAKRHAILAVGMVPIRAGIIRLREAYRTLVRPEEGGGVASESVRAHQLVRSDIERAPPLAEVLPEVAWRIQEGVLVLHHASVDLAFLRRDFARKGIPWPAPPVVDTRRLLLKHARLGDPRVSDDMVATDLSLARAQYRLPAYQAHDALADAVATAELFLALRIALGVRTVRDLRA